MQKKKNSETLVIDTSHGGGRKMELLWAFFVDPGSVPVFFLAQEPLLSASLDVQENFFGHACRLSFPTFPDLLHGGEIVLRRHCSRPCGIQGTMDNHVVTQLQRLTEGQTKLLLNPNNDG